MNSPEDVNLIYDYVEQMLLDDSYSTLPRAGGAVISSATWSTADQSPCAVER